MTPVTAAWVLLLVACLAGCVPFMVLQEARRSSSDGRPQVQSLPPDYDPAAPLPAYAGPHPRHQAWQPDPQHYPVRPGEVGPVDRSQGVPQYPFACDTEASRLGPPLPDNQQGLGTPVHRDGRVIGHSLDCQAATRIQWFYKPRGHDRLRRYDPQRPPNDVATVDHDGRRVPFVVRVERGTINRFIYVIGLLADPQGAPLNLWNQRLLYHFDGGVGIGKRQGRGSVNTAFARLLPALASGYAVAFSSGTRTDTHYDMRRAGRTAAMVKAQFLAAYGEPAVTIGIGASGGAALQYVLAQNHPGLLDGLIPTYSYPDVVTQASWALDCELLEHYFDRLAGDRRWRRQTERTAVQGLAASPRARNPFNAMDGWARLLRLERPRLPRGGQRLRRRLAIRDPAHRQSALPGRALALWESGAGARTLDLLA